MNFSALLLLLSMLPFAVGTRVEDEQVDFDAILVEALEDFDLSGSDLDAYSVEELLESEHFYRFLLAGWDVCVPVQDLKTNDGVDAFKEAITRTLDVAAVWAGWSLMEDAALEEVHEDVAVLQKWVKGWSKSAFKKAARAEGKTLFDRMPSAKDKVRAASERINARMALV